VTDATADRSRRIRRNSMLLGAVALAIYIAFIASAVLGWRSP
jgi:hypothetical protein